MSVASRQRLSIHRGPPFIHLSSFAYTQHVDEASGLAKLLLSSALLLYANDCSATLLLEANGWLFTISVSQALTTVYVGLIFFGFFFLVFVCAFPCGESCMFYLYYSFFRIHKKIRNFWKGFVWQLRHQKMVVCPSIMVVIRLDRCFTIQKSYNLWSRINIKYVYW